MKTQIVTANDLHTGGVVFLTTKGDWSPYISLAWVSDDSETDLLLVALSKRAVKKQFILEPYLILINLDNGIPSPISFREQLRVNGPSTQTEFKKPVFREAA